CGLFFFSSRRRHTRSKRDWSSDVCSSDLDASSQHQPLLLYADTLRWTAPECAHAASLHAVLVLYPATRQLANRGRNRSSDVPAAPEYPTFLPATVVECRHQWSL